MLKLKKLFGYKPKRKKLIGAVLIFGLTCLAGWLSFRLVHNLVLSGLDSSVISGLPVIPTGDTATADNSIGNLGGTLQVTEIQTPGLFPTSVPQLTPWDGTSRVTVLIMGLDYRDWEANEKYSRSDTMILLTLDPLTKTAGVLSIPRDLWVAIPGFQHGKINTAFFLGDAYKVPGGGAGLAVKTVETFLGIPINYYAVIDFDAFVKFIDDIGGVKVDITEPIKIVLTGGGPHTVKTLKPGIQVLPGEYALAYARNRYTENGDFDRARRQQQVIIGIRDRILDFNLLPGLIAKAPTLYQELSAGVHSNLALDDAIKLALLAIQVPKDQIKQAVISEKDTIDGWSPDQLSILIPIPDKIHALRDEVFATGESLGPLTAGDSAEKMAAEQARIAVYNGSRSTGLEQRVADVLRSMGANIIQTGAAPKVYSYTEVIDHTGSPYALRYLVDLLHISPYKVFIEYDPNASVDVEVFLGYDAETITLP
jgi:polyisoprenyl-teichoic acid--peptidoglycan teichoic acid transferase